METTGQNANFNKAYYEALKKIKDPVKNSFNPHYKNKFANINDTYECCRSALYEQGIVIMQPIDIKDNLPVVRTILLHIPSSEFLMSHTPIIHKPGDAANFVGGITYSRRVGLAAMLGLCSDDDDDGNQAIGWVKEETKPIERKVAHAKIVLQEQQLQELYSLLEQEEPDPVARNRRITAFCKNKKVNALNELSLAQYEETIARLKAKKIEVTV